MQRLDQRGLAAAPLNTTTPSAPNGCANQLSHRDTTFWDRDALVAPSWSWWELWWLEVVVFLDCGRLRCSRRYPIKVALF